MVDPARINNRKGLHCPLWTENKAKLIQAYIKLFTFVTKHGTYIDGFAAPQRRNHSAKCSAKLVLENEPQWVRDFWLCDIDPEGIALLEAIKTEHEGKNRRIRVMPGDFNASIEAIPASGTITEKTATFALLDQRTFECEWSTVQRIAAHKTTTKIEMFYFFATGWIDRSIAAIRKPAALEQAERWWGRSDWRDLRGMNGVERANLLAARFRDELGYRWAFPFAIHDAARGGRTMYHMVHATDHPEASPLMLRAYRKVSGRPDWDRPASSQIDLGDLWSEVV
ncbi:three-Cys-motif partner protein TcmP [Sphingomonas paucimobilis]|uniref:three-Cys-motif partner protein TcmP n=1 Tax=Sphingomonas paucimobilis TaxID=13689 RepID=UPI0037BAB6CA